MTPRPNSTKLRRAVFDRWKWTDPVTGRIMLTCHICTLPIDPAREKWDAEHIVRRVLSNSDCVENVMPAHVSCHGQKTRRDNSETAKGKRVHDKHYGITRKQGFRKPPEGYEYSWRARRVVKIGEDVE